MRTMIYDAHVFIADADDTTPTRVYLPGTPCVVSDLDTCPYCDNLLSEAGSDDPATGRVVRQHPLSGDHDGIVTFLYSNGGPGSPMMEQDPAHLRCVTEGSVLTLGQTDDTYGDGRHADNGTPRVLAGVAVDAHQYTRVGVAIDA